MEFVGEYAFDPAAIIGNGAFAIVFKGHRSQRPNEAVAVKRLSKKTLARLPSVLAKEICILKELTNVKHQNIVSLLECRENTENVFIVMEYCNGGDLAEYLRAHGHLSEQVITFFLRQIASALRVLHTKGIVHRDLKPQNILLCHNGQTKNHDDYTQITLKIADFGFARFLEDGVMAGTLCGSPIYMAPEVLMSQKYDGKADLWSVGALAYQCLTGRPPFQAKSPEHLKQLYRCNPCIIPCFPSGVSIELKQLLLGLLAQNPKNRMDFDMFFNYPLLNGTKAMGKDARHDSEPSLTNGRQPSLSFSPLVHLAQSNAKVKKSTSLMKMKDAYVPAERQSPRLREPSLSKRPESPSLNDYVVVSDVDDSGGGSWSIPTRDEISEEHLVGTPPNNSSPRKEQSSPVAIPMRARMFRHLMNDFPKTSSSPEICSASPSSCLAPELKDYVSRRSSMATVPSIESLSPPNVQFTIGTPSSCTSRCNSPCVLPSSPSQLSFHNQGSQYNLPHQDFCQVRYGSSDSMQSVGSSKTPSPPMFVDFVVPELMEKTLLSREEVELLDKLEFILDLSKCIIDCARARGSPLSKSIATSKDSGGLRSSALFSSESQCQMEQLQLYVRALQLLSSSIQLAKEKFQINMLSSTNLLKQVMTDINECYQQCLYECKLVNNNGAAIPFSESGSPSGKFVSTDRLLYACAIDLCQSAVMDEVIGSPQQCYQSYRSAHLLLHSLGKQATSDEDRSLLEKYRDCVEKRLINFHNQGFTCIRNA